MSCSGGGGGGGESSFYLAANFETVKTASRKTHEVLQYTNFATYGT